MERNHGDDAPDGTRIRRRTAAGPPRCARRAGRIATGRRTTVGGAALLAALAATAAFPEALHACPVCFDRDDEARIAFLATTGLLTLLPLGLVVGTGVWLRRRAREMRGGEEEGGGGD